MIDEQPTRALPVGGQMPVLGLGVWQIPDGRETEQAVEWALEAGYRARAKNERAGDRFALGYRPLWWGGHGAGPSPCSRR